MRHTANLGPPWWFILLAVFQAGCFAESDAAGAAGECGPRDLTPECCLKQLPGEWERCTGLSEAPGATADAVGRAPSGALRLTAAGMTGVVAAQSVFINSAERRGAELTADLLSKVEDVIVRCVREADRQVNAHHFGGRSPELALCQSIKVGERTTWAVYLGLFKHEQSWPCLREALDKLLPKKNYRLHPRFWLNERTGKWEYLSEDEVSQIVARHGWKGLTGTIEPDIVILDEQGFIVHVYDLKFPCPESNPALWNRYTLVSPKAGVETR